MAYVKKSNRWNATRLRANLAAAIQAAKTSVQVIEVDGQAQAVLVSIDEWRRVQGEAEKKKSLQQMWSAFEQLKRHSKDKNAQEELTPMPWKDPFNDAASK